MKEFNLSEIKSPESIQKRCWTMLNNYYRPTKFYGPDSTYTDFKIILNENELPIFECLGDGDNYLLLSTSYFYSICDNIEHKVKIEMIDYVDQTDNIQNERKTRTEYCEYIKKEIKTIDDKSVPYYIETGLSELILNKSLVDIVWMCNKFKAE
jgi:hypothetical protein